MSIEKKTINMTDDQKYEPVFQCRNN